VVLRKKLPGLTKLERLSGADLTHARSCACEMASVIASQTFEISERRDDASPDLPSRMSPQDMRKSHKGRALCLK